MSKSKKSEVKAIVINNEPTPKQNLCFYYLQCPDVEEILYGGSLGCLKSTTACQWLIAYSLKYPGTRWFIARKTLKRIKQTILKTFYECAARWNVQNRFILNKTDNVIQVDTGIRDKAGNTIYSEILLMHVDEEKDPELISWRGTEFTGGVCDEANEISENAKSEIKSRIRYKLKEFNLTPKLLLTCNPNQGYLKEQFYVPFKNNTLPPYRKFIQALPGDNPHLPESYIQLLEKLPQAKREVLLLGNWDFVSDNLLMEYDSILRMFYSSADAEDDSTEKTFTYYLSIDPARMGEDKTVIMVWKNFDVIEIKTIQKQTLDLTLKDIQQFIAKYKIENKNVILDIDGLGAGIADYIKGCSKIHNNARPFNEENYSNLKTQLYYRLSEYVNTDKVRIQKCTDEQKADILQELLNVKSNSKLDGKQSIISKEEIKKLIKRSPDYADALAYRFYWVVNPKGKLPQGEYLVRTGSISRNKR